MVEVKLTDLLCTLDQHVKDEMKDNPEIVDDDDLNVLTLPIEARRWHRVKEVVAVFADMKGSTNLDVGKHPASTAAIYEASTGGMVQVFSAFAPDFVAIQGDGAFALFWGDQRMERALCAAITVKTFSQKNLVPRLEKKWSDLSENGLKIGVAVSKILVKRVGVPRSAFQEPVWAGRAVNYAAKCAQQADAGKMIVTASVWDFVEGNDYLSVSCECGKGPSESIWQDVVIEKISDPSERQGRLLDSVWCEFHGESFCTAVLNGETVRPVATTAKMAMIGAQRANPVRESQRKFREAQRAQQRGLAMLRHH